MTFSGFFEIMKNIAAVFVLFVVITACIAIIAFIVVVSVMGLRDLIRERTHYVDVELLKERLGHIYTNHSDQSDFVRGIIQAEHVIDSILKGD